METLPSTVELREDIGAAKKGDIYIRGDLSHGTPDFYKKTNPSPLEWYWKRGTKKEDNAFLTENVIRESRSNSK